MKGIWRYSHLLPSVAEECKLTLGEGNTPLVKSRHLGPSLGLKNLYFKLESLNPSGSYKDRFAACAVSDLHQRNIRFCMATSSGNAGAALAAYSAAAGIKCYLVIVDGAPVSKIQQMQVYGSETFMVKDFGKSETVTEEAFSALLSFAHKHGSFLQISGYRYSPVGMAGVQTIAYEIAENFPDLAFNIFSPAGGGGLNLAISKGFQIWKEKNPAFKKPRIHSVQPEGNDTIASSLRNGSIGAREITKSTTSISGLQVPIIVDGNEVVLACRESQGTGFTVTDELIYDCQKNMAIKEGIFSEPAGAVALAGVLKALGNKEINREDHIVCLVTGHGFKDVASVEKMTGKECDHFFNSTRETLAFMESQILIST